MTFVDVVLLCLVGLLGSALVALWIHDKRLARTERALRESEERFHRVVDDAPVMLWTARPDTTLDFLNRNCETFTGMPLQKLRDEGWLDSVHPEDLERCIGAYSPAFEARTPFSVEYRVRRADGIYRWLLATGVPKSGPDGSFAGFIGCDVDITERREAEDLLLEKQTAIEASHLEIQQLAGRLITAHEDERRHLARELHDDVTQRLARLAIDVGRMENSTNAPAGLRPLGESLASLSRDVHTLSYRLHPSVLDDLGLVEALRTECDRLVRHGEQRVIVEASRAPAELSPDASLCLFRIAQEALSNAQRHSHASTVTVLLASRDSGLQLSVSDDGNGFDVDSPREHVSLGLSSMRERVRQLRGELSIHSAPGNGTTVVAWVPVGE